MLDTGGCGVPKSGPSGPSGLDFVSVERVERTSALTDRTSASAAAACSSLTCQTPTASVRRAPLPRWQGIPIGEGSGCLSMLAVRRRWLG